MAKKTETSSCSARDGSRNAGGVNGLGRGGVEAMEERRKSRT